MSKRQRARGWEAPCWQGKALVQGGSPPGSWLHQQREGLQAWGTPPPPPPPGQAQTRRSLLFIVVLFRHPWSFLTVKGNPSSSVEDHIEYHGNEWVAGPCVPPPLAPGPPHLCHYGAQGLSEPPTSLDGPSPGGGSLPCPEKMAGVLLGPVLQRHA